MPVPMKKLSVSHSSHEVARKSESMLMVRESEKRGGPPETGSEFSLPLNRRHPPLWAATLWLRVFATNRARLARLGRRGACRRCYP